MIMFYYNEGKKMVEGLICTNKKIKIMQIGRYLKYLDQFRCKQATHKRCITEKNYWV